MFNKLEKKWNAHTPTVLHNGTKENIVFQLTLVALFVGFLFAKDEWAKRRSNREFNLTRR